MPDLNAAESSAPAAPFDTPQVKDPATVLEDAADLLLIHGVVRNGGYGVVGGPRCAVGAITEVCGGFMCGIGSALGPLFEHVYEQHGVSVAVWNDATKDDFEVIDTLRHVAKDLRNAAVD